MRITVTSSTIEGSGPKTGDQLQASQQVNRLGKYLYKHLDGAFKIVKTGNMCDVYVTVLYQIPAKFLKKYGIKEEQYQKTNDMTININITTYQNKVRVNTIEMTEGEKTLGFDLYKPEELVDLQASAKRVFDKVCNHIIKEFQDYEFLF